MAPGRHGTRHATAAEGLDGTFPESAGLTLPGSCRQETSWSLDVQMTAKTGRGQMSQHPVRTTQIPNAQRHAGTAAILSWWQKLGKTRIPARLGSNSAWSPRARKIVWTKEAQAEQHPVPTEVDRAVQHHAAEENCLADCNQEQTAPILDTTLHEVTRRLPSLPCPEPATKDPTKPLPRRKETGPVAWDSWPTVTIPVETCPKRARNVRSESFPATAAAIQGSCNRVATEASPSCSLQELARQAQARRHFEGTEASQAL